jgi:glycosyltransferase involved in cell wall biosynthesis
MSETVVLTNLFPTPWEPGRGTFNLQAFTHLAGHRPLRVMVPVEWPTWLRRRPAPPPLPAELAGRVDWFPYWYPPRVGRALHPLSLLASLVAARPGRLLRRPAVLLASWAYPDAVAGAWLAALWRVPLVVKVHGSDLNLMAAGGLHRPQIRFALRRAAGVLAVSRALAGEARELGAEPDRIRVIYNGVDTTRFRPGDRRAARQALGLASGRRILLFVGNLKASKGCQDLLGAFARVAASQPRVDLHYVGDGPEAGELVERAASLGLGERVHLHGARPHAELAQWFNAANWTALPSHAEGVPNCLLESMASGTPVVASRVGGIPEVVPPEAGILHTPRKEEELAAALGEAMDRRWDRARLAGHAAGFDWATNARETDALLSRVTGIGEELETS